MDSQISSQTPGNDSAVIPGSSVPASGNGTAQPNGEANGQSASVEEMFGNVDPRTLPPQLKSVYDNMLRGFNEKTTKVAETVKSQVAKELEPYKTKATTYDQLIQQKEFVERWNQYVEEVNQKSQQQNVDPNDPNAKLLKEVEQLKREHAQTAAEVRTAKALDSINAFAEAVDDKGEKLHPDFDKFSSLSIGNHEKAGSYDLLRAAVELAPGNSPAEKLDNGYKAAKEVYDKIFEEGVKSGKGQLFQKVKNGTTPPSNVAASKFVNERPKDALEALQMARKGISVQR